MKYKKYNFSLEEIQLLFFMEKASHLQDELIIEVCSDMLKNKRKELITTRDNLTQFIVEIEREPAKRSQVYHGGPVYLKFLAGIYRKTG